MLRAGSPRLVIDASRMMIAKQMAALPMRILESGTAERPATMANFPLIIIAFYLPIAGAAVIAKRLPVVFVRMLCQYVAVPALGIAAAYMPAHIIRDAFVCSDPTAKAAVFFSEAG